MHIYDEIVARRDKRPCARHRSILKEQVVAAGEAMGKSWLEWENRDIFDFVHSWDTGFSRKPKTVKKRFDELRIVCDGAKWVSDLQVSQKTFTELVNMYMRIRAEKSATVTCTKQAQEISVFTARAVNGFLIGDVQTEPWREQLRIARILALAFAFVGGCRVGDLKHIRWGRVFEGKLEGKPAIYAMLDWSKTNMYGIKDDDYRIFPEFHLKVLCPVTLWRLYSERLPKGKKAIGPFYSVRTGKPFDTNVLLNGWKGAAEKLRFRTDFTAHSCRRSRITDMRNMGLSDVAIKKILGYAPNSQMPAHYDIKKRKGNKAAIEGEIKRYVSKLLEHK